MPTLDHPHTVSFAPSSFLLLAVRPGAWLLVAMPFVVLKCIEVNFEARTKAEAQGRRPVLGSVFMRFHTVTCLMF